MCRNGDVSKYGKAEILKTLKADVLLMCSEKSNSAKCMCLLMLFWTCEEEVDWLLFGLVVD